MKKQILIIFAIILVSICGCKSNYTADIKTNNATPLPQVKRAIKIPIWPKGKIPNVQSINKPELISKTKELIAGSPCTIAENVSNPTLTIFTPKGKNLGITVVVFPGGGYTCLAVDLEGTEICNWLTSIGVTAALLKYRVPNKIWGPYRESKQALEDAQRAIGLLRFHAVKLNINPNKIGVIGFSAGGHLAGAISTRFDKRLYKPVDSADNESCRPDFAMLLYPGHFWYADTSFRLNPNIRVTSKTPPAFIVHAENDPVDNVNNSIVYYIALKKAKVPAEMHLYAHGGHAFGLRKTKLPISEWPVLAEKWLLNLKLPESSRKQKDINSKSVNTIQFHTVCKGETLSSISRKYYGTPNNWEKVFKVNSKIIKNPNAISAGN